MTKLIKKIINFIHNSITKKSILRTNLLISINSLNIELIKALYSNNNHKNEVLNNCVSRYKEVNKKLSLLN